MKLKWLIFFLTIIITLFLFQNISSNERAFVVNIYMMNDERTEKLDGIYEGLKNLGYDLDLFEFHLFNAKDDRILLDEMIPSSLSTLPDLIVTLGGYETMELKKYLKNEQLNLPVIFVGIAATQEVGIVQGTLQPGEQISGITNHQTILSAKRLELLHTLVPTIEQTIVLYDSRLEVSKLSLEVVKTAANTLHIPIVVHDLATDSTLKQLETLSIPNGGLLTLPAYTIESSSEKIAQIAKKNNWYSMGIVLNDVKSGFLFSYGTSFYQQGYQSARFISKVYQGNLINELPIELPDSIELIINKKVKEHKGIVNEDLFPLATFYEMGSDN